MFNPRFHTACVYVYRILWHPSGESTNVIALADSRILLCDIEPSGESAKVSVADQICVCILQYFVS